MLLGPHIVLLDELSALFNSSHKKEGEGAMPNDWKMDAWFTLKTLAFQKGEKLFVDMRFIQGILKNLVKRAAQEKKVTKFEEDCVVLGEFTAATGIPKDLATMIFPPERIIWSPQRGDPQRLKPRKNGKPRKPTLRQGAAVVKLPPDLYKAIKNNYIVQYLGSDTIRYRWPYTPLFEDYHLYDKIISMYNSALKKNFYFGIWK